MTYRDQISAVPNQSTAGMKDGFDGVAVMRWRDDIWTIQPRCGSSENQIFITGESQAMRIASVLAQAKGVDLKIFPAETSH